MKAAVLAGPQKIEIKDIPRPEVHSGEMEIKISACGVCGSDIHMWKFFTYFITKKPKSKENC